MEKKPLIGIMPLYDPSKNSYWMLPKYLEALAWAGALATILPPRMSEADMEQVLNLYDGFLFPGGQDVEPALYGVERSVHCGAPAVERDELEYPLFRAAFEQNKPMLGVCRGLQLMNTVLGGTLYQDHHAERPDAMEHDMTAPYDRVFHTVTLQEGTPLRNLLGVEELGVNSYHHQSVAWLAPELKTMAVAPDGIIEAAYAPEKDFVWGIQWHPEYFWKQEQGAIFKAFVDAAKKR